MRNLITRATNIILRPDSEWTAIAVSTGVMLSTVAGYLGSTAGLFPHL